MTATTTAHRAHRRLNAGQRFFTAGEAGAAWRLVRGAVRLDTAESAGAATFANLAVAGDILGCETLLLGSYAFSASALVDCELQPWPEGDGAPAGESLLASLASAQRRAAETLALRGGQAVDRVLALMRLLADGAGRVVLPSRQDIADITDLRFETISRIVKQLERRAVLTPIRLAGVHATRSFAIDLRAFAG